MPLLPGSSDLDMASRMCAVLGPFTEATWKEGVQLASRKRVRIPPGGSSTLAHSLRQARQPASVPVPKSSSAAAAPKPPSDAPKKPSADGGGGGGGSYGSSGCGGCTTITAAAAVRPLPP